MSDPFINMYSDTVTRPTPARRGQRVAVRQWDRGLCLVP